MAEFLFEIGLEEVPARMIASAEAELSRRVTALLERERLVSAGAAVKSFSTPRRLAVLVSGVLDKQEALAEEILGPSAKIAYKDGVATPAAVAFAKKAGVVLEELKTVATPKGDYLAATSLKGGRAAEAVIAEGLPKELTGIYWAKNMYWRPGKPERFVRPVRWMVALLDETVVPVEFAGYTAGNVTYGHRVLAGAEPIVIAKPAEYAAKLEGAFVAADVEARRHRIRKALDHVCRAITSAEGSAGMRWREDHELVDKLTHLTEWPSVIAGGFEAEYLTLPEEVLVTVMRDHQNYFAVESADGKLAPHFLAVLNTAATSEGETVIRHGNERVLRARFNDARFFWEFDQRVRLDARVEKLSFVTFQNKLGNQGNYREKTKRIGKLTADLIHLSESPKQTVPVIPNVDEISLERAVLLAKTDLMTELVKEFTELQGQIGGLYAEDQGETRVTSIAIYDHYRPESMKDLIPRTIEGSLLSIADKADTIAGMFALGLEPTGSKDPFALRRAANGVIRILAESENPLDRSLNFISARASAAYGDRIVSVVVDSNPDQKLELDSMRAVEIPINQASLSAKVSTFFTERLEFYLREARGQAYDVVAAVLKAGANDVRDAVARAEAVTSVRGSADFAAVSAAFKRMKNILAQAGDAVSTSVDAALLVDPAEQSLAERSAEVAARVESLRASREYVAALEAIASLRPQVDGFFDAVMVMAPEPDIRANRLALLALIVTDFSRIADFSEIVVAG